MVHPRLVRTAAAAVRRIRGLVEGEHVDPGDAGALARMAGHRPPLCLDEPQLRRGIAEIAQQQRAIDRLETRGPRIGKAARRLDAVDQPRIGVGEHVLQNGAAGAAVTDHVADLAVLLDDPLLDHHHGLGRHDVVVVLPVRVQGAGGDHEAGTEPLRVQDARRVPLVVVRRAAPPEAPRDLAVPPGLRRPRHPRLRRIEQHRDGIPAAIDDARLPAHDERHRPALIGGGHRDVRSRMVRVVTLQAAAAGRAIEELVLRRRVALRVQRWPEAVRDRVADPRLDLEAGEHGPADGMVRDGDRRARAVRRARRENVRALRQPGDEADVAAVGTHAEGRGHVAPVDVDPDPRGIDPGRQHDLDEGVAAADEVRPVRQHRDVESILRARRRRRVGDGSHHDCYDGEEHRDAVHTGLLCAALSHIDEVLEGSRGHGTR